MGRRGNMAFGKRLWATLALVALGESAAAQTVVGDPKNPARTFSSYCSACHKTPAGLAQSASASGLNSFLRQHYTTGQEMSSAMAEYLLSARGDPRAVRQTTAQPQRGEVLPPGRRATGIPEQPPAPAQESTPVQRRRDAAIRPPGDVPATANAARTEANATVTPERPPRPSPQAGRERTARTSVARPPTPAPTEEPSSPAVEAAAAAEAAPSPAEERQPAFDAPSP